QLRSFRPHPLAVADPLRLRGLDRGRRPGLQRPGGAHRDRKLTRRGDQGSPAARQLVKARRFGEIGTVNGTATTSDGDYLAKTGTLTFAPGETTKTITIEVKGDDK